MPIGELSIVIDNKVGVFVSVSFGGLELLLWLMVCCRFCVGRRAAGVFIFSLLTNRDQHECRRLIQRWWSPLARRSTLQPSTKLISLTGSVKTFKRSIYRKNQTDEWINARFYSERADREIAKCMPYSFFNYLRMKRSTISISLRLEFY